MPGPVQDIVTPPVTASITVSVEPAQNAVYSLVLLHRADDLSGLGEWIATTRAALSAEERARHELVIIGLFYAVLPQESWPSFAAYVDHLAGLDPVVLRAKMLHTYARFQCGEGGVCHRPNDAPLPVDWDAVLRSPEAYVEFLLERFGPEIVDEALERRAYAYVIDPPAMQALIVSHLREMWARCLEPEWRRTEPMLQDAVRACSQVDLGSMSRFEAMQRIVGQDLDAAKWQDALEEAERVILVPSAHIGPYQGRLGVGKTMWVLFGARLPEGVQYHAPDLSRAEILVRLTALADNNRLRILRLIAENGELSSQEIIARLDLSQSSVSRHLNQLRATGYLVERRCNGAKCYRLAAERIQHTLQAVQAYLLAE